MSRWLLAIMLLMSGFCLLIPGSGAIASQAQNIEEEIQAREEQVQKHKSTLERLSEQERKTYSQLAETEDRLDELSERLEQQEQELSRLQSREAEIFNKYQQLNREREKTREKAGELMESLWPIYLESRAQGLSQLEDWAEMDRQSHWLRTMHQEMNQTLALLQQQTREIASQLAELQKTKEEYEARLDEVNQLKDRMLEKKLSHLQKLQEIRAEKLAREEQVEEIMEVIESLNYQLKAVTERDIEDMKGHLPWPAEGEVVASYDPSHNPPRNGLSIDLEEGSLVRAVSWGKVVHNDTLRGFGRVVILFHGEKYYSLYAYLSESHLAVGKEVEQGEPVGYAGFYPDIESHGLYFELRFKQEPINPDEWLG